MPRIAIVTPHVTTGAAVSSDVLGMYRVLERHGYESRIYAESWDLEVPEISSINEIHDFLTRPEDIFLYHHSIGSTTGLEFLRTQKCRTIIKYHNVTPPEFFSGISRWHEEKCREGQQQLKLIARNGCDLYLADSEYNRQALLAAGSSDATTFVVPPFHNIEAWHSLYADLDTLDAYRDGKANIVSVSRVAPHKGHRALIEAFAVYHHEYNPDSRLLIVGREESNFSSYSVALRELVKFLLLEKAVIFAGEISDATLKSVYLLADTFISASEHEGFCVPLVEAMALKVPIITYASAAIPETVGDAGIVLSERNPDLMAESVNQVVQDETVNVALGITGRRRYEHVFIQEKIETRFLSLLSIFN